MDDLCLVVNKLDLLEGQPQYVQMTQKAKFWREKQCYDL